MQPTDEMRMMIGGLSAAIEAYGKQGGEVAVSDMVAFTFAFARGVEASSFIARDPECKLDALLAAARAMLDGLALKKPTVADLAPVQTEMEKGVATARSRYLEMKPTTASQVLSFEILGYIEAMKENGSRSRDTIDVLASLLKRLRKVAE